LQSNMANMHARCSNGEPDGLVHAGIRSSARSEHDACGETFYKVPDNEKQPTGIFSKVFCKSSDAWSSEGKVCAIVR